MGLYVADFETTTRLDKTRVWAYSICSVDNPEEIYYGTNIDDFMKWCMSNDNHTIYFHNLKFDIQFILYYLLKNGYKHIEDKKDKDSKTFSTLISDKGLFYSMEVIFELKNKHINKVNFLDSYKLIPLSVEDIAKALKLPIQKLEIDYASHDFLPDNTPLSKEEKDYITNDVRIVAYAIKYFKDQGLDKMTIGSCALDEYKKIINKYNFNKYYPIPKYHEDVKQSYRGGFTWLNNKFASKTIGHGLVLDYNSMYPSVMRTESLPFGSPIFFKGKYEKDSIYPLYTQMFKCQFEIKEGKIPTIQIKYGYGFRSNEYLTSSGASEVTLCLNSVDLELFFNQYNVYNIEYISGWKFKATKGLFDKYIDKWSNNKIQAKKEGNHGLYLISKLFLNSLYGKFGTDTKVRSKIPYLEDDIVKYRTSAEEIREPIYVAIASFITSYARLRIISAAQRIMNDYLTGKSKVEIVYTDTDSLHVCLNGESKEDFLNNCGLTIHPTNLNAWDFESEFIKARFLRQKCYIEKTFITEDEYNNGIKGDYPYLYTKENGVFFKLKITVAGMPKECYPYVNFKNFKIGATYKGKKQPKNIKGGVVLNKVDFTIKDV